METLLEEDGPFVGLRSFRRSEQHLFFGRDRDAQVVCNLVLTLPVLVIYAPSGTGKSSLLNAGVVPLLEDRSSLVTVFIANPGMDLPSELAGALGIGGDEQRPVGRDICRMLEIAYQQTGRRVVLILDQFEERLKQESTYSELFPAIARHANMRSESATIVISLRDDYLSSLEPLMKRVPGLMDASYKVLPLTTEDLRSAIVGPIGAAGSSIVVDPGLVENVLGDLSDASDGGYVRLEAGYLQIVWQRLWMSAAARSLPVIGLELYEELGKTSRIIHEFTNQAISRLTPLETEVFSAMLRYLIRPTGAKVALTADDLANLVRPDDLTRTGQVFLLIDDLASAPWASPTQPRATSIDGDLLRGQIDSVLAELTASDMALLRRVVRGDRTEFELVHDLLGLVLLAWRRDYEASAQVVQGLDQAADVGIDTVDTGLIRTVEAWSRRLSKVSARLESPDQTALQKMVDMLEAELPDLRAAMSIPLRAVRLPHKRHFAAARREFAASSDGFAAAVRKMGPTAGKRWFADSVQRIILALDRVHRGRTEIREGGGVVEHLLGAVAMQLAGAACIVLGWICWRVTIEQLGVSFAPLTLGTWAVGLGLASYALYTSARREPVFDWAAAKQSVLGNVPDDDIATTVINVLISAPVSTVIGVGFACLTAWIFLSVGLASATAGFTLGAVVAGATSLLWVATRG